MRNLRVIEQWWLEKGQDALESRQVGAVTWDTSFNSVRLVSHNDRGLWLQRWLVEELAEGRPKCIPEKYDYIPNVEDRVLDFHRFPDIKLECLVFASGDLVTMQETPDQQVEVEIAGSVDVGLVAATWSPDEELLVLVSKTDTVIFMSRDFDEVANISLSDADLSTSKQVSVGWGKTETQFRGKGAKALRDPTIPEKVDQGLKSSKDDISTTISWRGDGAYVAINSCQASPRRVIRIYSREGELDGVSEPVDYLEAALSWRPAGNILASVRRLEGHVEIIFFERNGLRHGQFQLRTGTQNAQALDSPIALQWNCDSSILCVSFADRLQMWTMGNYHYYLKQEHLLSSTGLSRLAQIAWHPEEPLLCAVATQGTNQAQNV